MIEIGLAEAEQQMSALLARAIEGEQIAITQFGQTVACIMPGGAQTTEEQKDAEAAISRIESRSALLTGQFCWEVLKRDRDLGRR